MDKAKYKPNPKAVEAIDKAFNTSTRDVFEALALQCEKYGEVWGGSMASEWNLLAYHVRKSCDNFLGGDFAATSDFVVQQAAQLKEEKEHVQQG